MELKTQYTRDGKVFEFRYRDEDPLTNLGNNVLQGVHAFCFCGDKLVIVGSDKKGYWTPPGGGIEPGETYDQAVMREVKEETNMKVLYQEQIGYQDVWISDENRTIRQVRVFCIVEPYGDFVSDPDGDITEIKLVDPQEFREYIKWGEIGDYLMKRALELKAKYKE